MATIAAFQEAVGDAVLSWMQSDSSLGCGQCCAGPRVLTLKACNTLAWGIAPGLGSVGDAEPCRGDTTSVPHIPLVELNAVLLEESA